MRVFIRVFIAAVISLFMSVSIASSIELPAPPAGYQWEECSEIGGALLRPESWSFHHIANEEKVAYFITKEAWQPPRNFEVGLSFNVLFDIPAKHQVRASEFARQYVGKIRESHKSARAWSDQMGLFKSEGIIYSGTGAQQGFKFFNLVLANDKTGTAHVVVFKAPETNWDSDWKIIEPAIQRLLIDDDY